MARPGILSAMQSSWFAMGNVSDVLFGIAGSSGIRADVLGVPEILVSHIAADLILGAAHLAVLAALIWFLQRRPDLVRDQWLLALLIGGFLAATAISRVAQAISGWQ